MVANNEISNGNYIKKDDEIELFKIEETLKTAFNASVCCIIVFLLFIIVISVMLFIKPPEGVEPIIIPIIVIIIWVVVIPGFIIILPLFRGLRKLRVFLITDKAIRFKLPTKDPFQTPAAYSFQIDWIDFDKIEIEKRSMFRYIYNFLPISRVYYILVFKKEEQVISEFKFESGIDFKTRTRKRILNKLSEILPTMNKEYIGP